MQATHKGEQPCLETFRHESHSHALHPSWASTYAGAQEKAQALEPALSMEKCTTRPAAPRFTKDANGRLVLRLTNFKTSNGPDVHVVLIAAKDADDDANFLKNSTERIELGALKGNEGRPKLRYTGRHGSAEVSNRLDLLRAVQRELRRGSAREVLNKPAAERLSTRSPTEANIFA
jgi:hypothetical protein